MEIRSALRFTLSGSKTDVSIVFEHVCFDTVDGNRFCATTNNKNVYSGDVSQNKIKFLIKLDFHCVAICIIQKVDGAEVAIIGQSDGSIISLDIGTGRVLSSNPGFGEPFHHISTHPSADRVVTSYKSSAIVWNVTDELLPVQRLKISESADLLQASFGFDGSSIVTCFCDGRIIIWDFPSLVFWTELGNSSSVVGRDGRPVAPLISAAVSRDGKYLAATGKEPILVLWDLIHNSTNPQMFDLSDTFADIKQIEILSSFNESTVVICLGVDGLLWFFNVFSKTEIKPIRKSKSDRRYVKIIAAPHSKVEYDTLGALDTMGSLDILNLLPVFKKIHPEQKIPPKISENVISKIPAVVSKTGEMETVSRTPPDLDIVSIHQLNDILKTFGEFPNKYRFLIWRHALNLPRNKLAFATLLDRGIHPMFHNLEETFDVLDEGLLLDLKKILSALSYWCSLFAEVNYLPLFVFPFVKVLRHDLLTCFEVIVTCIVNFCHNWFEYFPAPPFSVLADVDMFLSKDSPSLLEHFNSKGVTAQVYAWPLLKTLFSEVFTQDEWLKIWDHIILHKNDRFLLAITAAYSIISQHSLLACQDEADCKRYFREKNPIPIKPLLEMALKLLDFVVVTPGMPKAVTFKPLSKDTYPIFYNFPHAVVENHAKELRKIRELEADYLNQRKVTLEIEAKYGTVIEQEEELRRREAIFRTAEGLRRQEIVEEDQRLAEQRSRLQVLTKELQERELAILEAHRRSLNREKMVRKEEEINRLQDQLLFRTTLRESELRDAVEMAEMRKLRILADSCRLNADVMQGSLNSRDAVNYFTERYENEERNPFSSSDTT